MSEKSHVSMEQHVCMICCARYDTGAILLDRRLRNNLERNTITGWGLCAECQRLHEEGFIALVECDATKSGTPADGALLKPEQAYRTGQVARLKREVFGAMFNVPAPPNLPCVYVEAGMIEKLRKMATH
jgi:hypothetical protein